MEIYSVYNKYIHEHFVRWSGQKCAGRVKRALVGPRSALLGVKHVLLGTKNALVMVRSALLALKMR